jgi:hypothetical protein
MRTRQRYLCKNCRFYFTTGHRGKPPALRCQALQLYLEGLGFRGIGRFLRVSNVTVLNWIKSFGREVAARHQPEGGLPVIEMDELHSFVESKKNLAGFGWLLIGMGKDGSISCLAIAQQLQEISSGNVSARLIRKPKS